VQAVPSPEKKPELLPNWSVLRMQRTPMKKIKFENKDQ